MKYFSQNLRFLIEKNSIKNILMKSVTLFEPFTILSFEKKKLGLKWKSIILISSGKKNPLFHIEIIFLSCNFKNSHD